MLGLGIGFSGAVPAASSAPAPFLLAVAALEAAHAVSDDLGGWTGFTTETFDTVTTCTTPDQIYSAIMSWRNNPNNLLDLICDWNGVLDFANPVIGGPPVSVLTADAGVFGGYVRPVGGVRIRNAAGKTPAFGNGLKLYGFPKIEFSGLGFARQAGGADGRNVYCVQPQCNTTFPIPNALVFRNCRFGLGHWAPGEPTSEFCRSIALSGDRALSCHVEDCDFSGAIDLMGGAAKFWRVHNNYARNMVGDFLGVFDFRGGAKGWTSADRANVWVEGNIVCDYVDDAAFAALHQDFLQTGAYADIHNGYSVLCRRNIAHMSGAVNGDSQGNFNNDHPTADNEICVYDNLFSISAWHGIHPWDFTGVRAQFIHSNTVVSSGRRPSEAEARIEVENTIVGPIYASYGPISILNNLVGEILNPGGYPLSEAGNRFASPAAGMTSGDGLTGTAAKRYEDMFTGTFLRDGNDFMTFDLTGEGDNDKSVSFYAIIDQFTPVAGWGVTGCSDPETWPNAPARP